MSFASSFVDVFESVTSGDVDKAKFRAFVNLHFILGRSIKEEIKIEEDVYIYKMLEKTA